MKLEPLYRAEFTYPEAWAVDLEGPAGTEAQHFFIAEGRCQGGISGCVVPIIRAGARSTRSSLTSKV